MQPMQSQFHDQGTFYTFEHFDPTKSSQTLPPAVYELDVVERQGMQITQLSKRGGDYIQGPVRYGNHDRRLKLIQESYARTNPSMGVMLVGLKGSGKSLFAEDMGNWMIRGNNLPVIMVMSPLPPSIIRKAIQAVGPCMVYFDEFGKSYEKPAMRDKMISLFSDSDLTGVLFIVTANSFEEFVDPMVDRPGRFRFRIKFDGLSPEQVAEVGVAHGLSEERIVGLMRYANTCHIGYDTLDTVAELVKDVATDNEAREKLAVINVPSWGWSGLTINSVSENGRRIVAEEVEYDGATLTIVSLEGENHDQERKIQIPLIETRDWYLKFGAQKYTHGDVTISFTSSPSGGGAGRYSLGGNQATAGLPERRAYLVGEARPDKKSMSFDVRNSNKEGRAHPSPFDAIRPSSLPSTEALDELAREMFHCAYEELAPDELDDLHEFSNQLRGISNFANKHF